MIDLFGNEKMLALSWKQPYGNLMLPPNNKIETRTWNTNYRGLVLICISKQMYKTSHVKNISGDFQYKRINESGAYVGSGHFGMAIAVGRLIDCRPMKKDDEDKCFVQYYPDLYCHIYQDIKPIKPFPWKGSQGWKIVTQEIIKQIQLITN